MTDATRYDALCESRDMLKHLAESLADMAEWQPETLVVFNRVQAATQQGRLYVPPAAEADALDALDLEYGLVEQVEATATHPGGWFWPGWGLLCGLHRRADAA